MAVTDRKALLVGNNDYTWARFPNLRACVHDVVEIAPLLAQNDDNSDNYRCDVLRSDERPVTRAELRKRITALFAHAEGDLLFYYSGHADRDATGIAMIAQDGDEGAPGVPLSDLLTLAVASKARSKLIILDCCFAGGAGMIPMLGDDLALISNGITILSATSPRESAIEVNGHGVFTGLLIAGLQGGAADVRGNVSAAALYGYAEAALGVVDQRPFYKSHTQSMAPVRRCTPAVPDALLDELPLLFDEEGAIHAMSAAYEFTNPFHDPAKVAIFNKLKRLRNAGLAVPHGAEDLFWSAVNNQGAVLTPLGRYYWRLAKQGRFETK